MKMWTCKIGEVEEANVPTGSDLPMRQAVAEAYERITGKPALFIFSGWGDELSEPERAVVENRLPVESARPEARDKIIEECAAACDAEHLTDPILGESGAESGDEIYDRAVRDCSAAVRTLKTPLSPQREKT